MYGQGRRGKILRGELGIHSGVPVGLRADEKRKRC